MLNNITNFFNLIKTGKVKTQLDGTDILPIGTRDNRFTGQYQPTMIKYSNLVAGMIGGSNGQVLFKDNGIANGAANLYWDKVNERLGIGTSSPLVELQLQGSFHGYNDVYAQRGTNMLGLTNWGVNGNKPTLYAQTDIFISPNIGNAFVFKTSGNFLINTTTDAGFKLDVNGTARVVNEFYLGNTATTGGNIIVNRSAIASNDVIAKFDFQRNSISMGYIEAALTSGVLGYAFYSNGQDHFRLTTSAATFGKTNGTSNIQVGIWTNSNHLTLGSSTSAVANIDTIFQGGYGEIAKIRAIKGTNAAPSGQLSFFTHNGTSSVETMRIFSTGNIGINTTTDAGFRLDVNGTARVTMGASAEFRLGTSSALPAMLYTTGSTSYLMRWKNDGSEVYLQGGTFAVLRNTTQEFILQSNFTYLSAGNLAIGTATNAGFRLDVNGTSRFSDNVFLPTNVLIGSGQSITVWNRIMLYDNTNGAINITMHNPGWYIRHNANMSMAGAFHAGSNTSVDASAVLQATSTTQGFLPPRMTSAQRTAIATPAVGLMVYQTDATEGLYIYKSTGWALNS